MDMDVNVNGARVKSQEYPRFTKEQGPQRSAGRATPPPTTRGGSEWYCGGGFRTAKAVEPRTVASTLPPLSVAPWFPDSADRQVSESNSRSFTSASLCRTQSLPFLFHSFGYDLSTLPLRYIPLLLHRSHYHVYITLVTISSPMDLEIEKTHLR